ncbi:hypothetical protein [cyanobacterium endosymbiont of Rhopalodia gibberula]|uniref:hypothetical protein n=1 Tax=cyanobacterium endosymbiont of Rhopalodia gibberula TaxID=1763363 RepID=UPI002682F320
MTIQATTIPIEDIIEQQRALLGTCQTKSVNFRLTQLENLKQGIIDHQEAIVEVTKDDFVRPEFESYFEIITPGKINLALQNLKFWIKPQQVPTSFDQFLALAGVRLEPMGVVLIIGP